MSTRTDGIRVTLRINATKIPNEIRRPISLALGNVWDRRLIKLIIVVTPAKRIGIPTLRIVLRKICPRVAIGSDLEYSK
jgi:hypothetical protein